MRWPGYQHVFFDCDSTLTTVEGIDVLADTPEKQALIEALTRDAMDGKLDLAEVYGRRLQAIRPTREQVQKIHLTYKKNEVEDATDVIGALKHLGHAVYIISGGLAQPVEQFGLHLGVAREHIRAVGLQYDELAGDWWHPTDYVWNEPYMAYHEGALTISDGKAKIVNELRGDKTGRSILIGDGSSDLLAGRAVDLFVGYGGVVQRERVYNEAPAFVSSLSLAPFLVLATGPATVRQLINTPYEAVFRKGLSLIGEGAVRIQDERLNAKFFDAYQALYTGPHGGAS